MSRELEILFERSASLLFELQAFRDGQSGSIIRRPVGSGMFFAGCQGLTARHVVTDMHNVNPGWADHMRRQAEGFRLLPYWGSASQLVDLKDTSQSADWGLTNIWLNPVTDIAILQLAPIDENAKENLSRMRPLFPKWSLLPPPVGTSVVVCGQPRDCAPNPDCPAETLTYTCRPAVVVANHELHLDRGMYDFPCFIVDVEVPHGMSGGPVFWGDRLCGLVSGGFWGQTVVASLWPVCLTEFENPALGQLNAAITFESLFASNQITAVDWHLVRGRISYKVIDGRPVALLRPPA